MTSYLIILRGVAKINSKRLQVFVGNLLMYL